MGVLLWLSSSLWMLLPRWLFIAPRHLTRYHEMRQVGNAARKLLEKKSDRVTYLSKYLLYLELVQAFVAWYSVQYEWKVSIDEAKDILHRAILYGPFVTSCASQKLVLNRLEDMLFRNRCRRFCQGVTGTKLWYRNIRLSSLKAPVTILSYLLFFNKRARKLWENKVGWERMLIEKGCPVHVARYRTYNF